MQWQETQSNIPVRKWLFISPIISCSTNPALCKDSIKVLHTYILYIYIYIYIYTLYIILEQIFYQFYNVSSFRNHGRGFLVNKLESKDLRYPFNMFAQIMTRYKIIFHVTLIQNMNKELVRELVAMLWSHSSIWTGGRKP